MNRNAVMPRSYYPNGEVIPQTVEELMAALAVSQPPPRNSGRQAYAESSQGPLGIPRSYALGSQEDWMRTAGDVRDVARDFALEASGIAPAQRAGDAFAQGNYLYGATQAGQAVLPAIAGPLNAARAAVAGGAILGGGALLDPTAAQARESAMPPLPEQRQLQNALPQQPMQPQAIQPDEQGFDWMGAVQSAGDVIQGVGDAVSNYWRGPDFEPRPFEEFRQEYMAGAPPEPNAAELARSYTESATSGIDPRIARSRGPLIAAAQQKASEEAARLAQQRSDYLSEEAVGNAYQSHVKGVTDARNRYYDLPLFQRRPVEGAAAMAASFGLPIYGAKKYFGNVGDARAALLRSKDDGPLRSFENSLPGQNALMFGITSAVPFEARMSEAAIDHNLAPEGTKARRIADKRIANATFQNGLFPALEEYGPALFTGAAATGVGYKSAAGKADYMTNLAKSRNRLAPIAPPAAQAQPGAGGAGGQQAQQQVVQQPKGRRQVGNVPNQQGQGQGGGGSKGSPNVTRNDQINILSMLQNGSDLSTLPPKLQAHASYLSGLAQQIGKTPSEMAQMLTSGAKKGLWAAPVATAGAASTLPPEFLEAAEAYGQLVRDMDGDGDIDADDLALMQQAMR